jgi:hypothetical protein
VADRGPKNRSPGSGSFDNSEEQREKQVKIAFRVQTALLRPVTGTGEL